MPRHKVHFSNIATTNLKNRHKKNKKRYDRHRMTHTFLPEQVVWYNWPLTKDNKLTLSFKGTFIIQHAVEEVCYRINWADTNKKRV